AVLDGARGHAVLTRLRLCAELEQPLTVRWACLLLDVPAAQIAPLNNRCKVPRECAELAQLVSQHRGAWLRAAELPAEDLLALLQSFDVYRRPQRFEQFLAACEMAHRVEGEAAAARTRYLRG